MIIALTTSRKPLHVQPTAHGWLKPCVNPGSISVMPLHPPPLDRFSERRATGLLGNAGATILGLAVLAACASTLIARFAGAGF